MNKKTYKQILFGILAIIVFTLFFVDKKFQNNLKMDFAQISSIFTNSKSDLLKVIDEDFHNLTEEQKANSRIDLNDIQSGGPRRDDIPSLIHPNFETINKTKFSDDELIIGVAINGKARAYPYSILNWHEIINDTIDDVAFTVTLCPLCDTNPVFERKIDGEVTTFGVSGKLFNSCLIMYDRKTETLWSQPWGAGILGEKVNQTLKQIPAFKTTLGDWKKEYPDTLVLSLDTGHKRNYSRYPYGTYYTNEEINFPVRSQDKLTNHPKDIVSYISKSDNNTPFNQFSGESYQISHKELQKKKLIKFNFDNKKYTALWNDKLQTAIFLDENNQEIPSSTAFAFVYPAYFQ